MEASCGSIATVATRPPARAAGRDRRRRCPSGPAASRRKCRHWRWCRPAWRRCGRPALDVRRSRHGLRMVSVIDHEYPTRLAPASGCIPSRERRRPHTAMTRPRSQSNARNSKDSYTAQDIEVLEGLEPVRRRPGMYIGGTDERALHHLVAEVLDNAMDEAVAGHATRIELELAAGDRVTVRDNGRGIPVDPHPKFQGQVGARGHPDHAAFRRQVRRQGLRDLGRPARRRRLGGQRAVRRAGGRGRARPRSSTSRATPAACRDRAAGEDRRGRQPARHDRQLPSRSRDLRRRRPLPAGAALPHGALQGLSVPRRRDPLALRSGAARPERRHVPAEETLHFPGGLDDFLDARCSTAASRDRRRPSPARPSAGRAGRAVEWAVAWPTDEEGFIRSYCNTVPDARRRHARGGPAQRAAARPAAPMPS